jgi:hypothetical protein
MGMMKKTAVKSLEWYEDHAELLGKDECDLVWYDLEVTRRRIEAFWDEIAEEPKDKT